MKNRRKLGKFQQRRVNPIDLRITEAATRGLL